MRHVRIGQGVIVLVAAGVIAVGAEADADYCRPLPGPALVPVRVAAPPYPPQAIQARVQGKVIVTLTVAPSGSVVAEKTCMGIPLLDVACTRAAKQWRFPAVETTESRTAQVTCRFVLDREVEIDLVTYVVPDELEIHGFTRILR